MSQVFAGRRVKSIRFVKSLYYFSQNPMILTLFSELDLTNLPATGNQCQKTYKL